MTFIKRFLGQLAAFAALGFLFQGMTACNNNLASGNAAALTPSQTVTIKDFSFSSVNLTARPGEVIRVVNEDDSSHTLTSQSAPDAFDDSGEFDSGTINGHSEALVSLPTDAAPGEKFYFYCDIHLDGMRTANGTITITN